MKFSTGIMLLKTTPMTYFSIS